ncbi:MAG: DNA polymerase III subunit gamma/tau [Ferruginibacter sp.]|nr:DNA polymerase III subunit gamma/tau [Ferruginibacter sp.]
MEKFIVSARKYRPQNFSTVVGQSHITTTLKNAINNNQLAHAFLFTGPRGVGKTTCARILAKTINCEKRTKNGEACNKCNSCVSFDNGTSFNIHELDAASNNSVDDIRALVDQVRFAPQAGQYKVYIVDEVHMLSTAAFNAFLKTLEEPPSYAIFILATTEKHKILPTILSRCQIFDFKRITINDTTEHLQEIAEKEDVDAEKTALHLIAQKSEGCMRDALSILDKIVSFTGGKITYTNTLEHLNILDEDYYFKLLDLFQQQHLTDSILLFDEINQKGFEGDTLLEGLSEFFRNLLVSKDPKAAVLLEVAEDFKAKYLDFAQKVDTGWLIAALNILNESIVQYKLSRNKKLHVELLLIKLAYLKQALRISINEDAFEKKKLTDISKTISFKSLPVSLFKEEKNKVRVSQKTEEAKLYIEEPVREIQKVVVPTAPKTPDDASKDKPITKIATLGKIRQQIAQKNNVEQRANPLSLPTLELAWNQFIEMLVSRQNHSAVTNFKLAKLNCIDDNNFEVIAENSIQFKFIESERAFLLDHIQLYFNNRHIKYQLILEEKENHKEEGPKPLNTKAFFTQLAEQYPLLLELKDRLKLDLDY